MSASENAATVLVNVVVKGTEARKLAESEGCKTLKKCIGVKGQVGELIAIVWLKLEQRMRQLSREVGVGSNVSDSEGRWCVLRVSLVRAKSPVADLFERAESVNPFQVARWAILEIA